MTTDTDEVRAVPAAAPRWRNRIGELAHTGSAVAAHAPENAAYGLIAMAPLGAAFGPGTMMLTPGGLVSANVVASLAGGGRLVSGSRASIALLTASFSDWNPRRRIQNVELAWKRALVALNQKQQAH